VQDDNVKVSSIVVEHPQANHLDLGNQLAQRVEPRSPYLPGVFARWLPESWREF